MMMLMIQGIKGNAIVMQLNNDIITLVESLQVCAGHEAGCKSLIHPMPTLYEERSGEAVLLVDASSTFNSVNSNEFLHNFEIIFPPITLYLKKCYSVSTQLRNISGGKTQLMEGKTQGNLAVIKVHTIAIIPVILMLVEKTLQGNYNTFTVYAVYADDLTVAEPINQHKKQMNLICRLGSKFGYRFKGSKSWLVIKKIAEEPTEFILNWTNVKIIIQTNRYVGAVI